MVDWSRGRGHKKSAPIGAPFEYSKGLASERLEIKFGALVLVLIHCILAGGCVNDRLKEKLLEGAEFVPAESSYNHEEESWESSIASGCSPVR